MTCLHIPSFVAPTTYSNVYKEECLLCFETPESLNGIDVCLTCLQSGCSGPETMNHTSLHHEKTGHKLYLNIKKIKLVEPPKKITKLVVDESLQEKYETKVKTWCVDCKCELGNCEQIEKAVNGIMNATSATQKQEIKSWEEVVEACEHTVCLEQNPTCSSGKQIISRLKVPKKCNECDMKENLWLCMTCGNVGCGRRQFDGSGGNNHGMEHFEKTGHPVSLKLGTITAEGEADIYCYKCNDMRLDPELESHLKLFGINVKTQQKTEKNMAEMQLDQNITFNMKTVDGEDYENVFGPGLTGIKNIGNSCYLASVVQSLFYLRPFQQEYYETAIEHHFNCREKPQNCFECQMGKIAMGLLSGNYSKPPLNLKDQLGISPTLFKSVISQNNREFASMRQQDAFEFYQFMINLVEQKSKIKGTSPHLPFQFNLTQRLECANCHKVKYSNVTSNSISLMIPQIENASIINCFEATVSPENVQMNCPSCSSNQFYKSTGFGSFPEILVIQMQRFVLNNWTPEKLDKKVTVPLNKFSLEQFRLNGPLENEVELPNQDSKPSLNEAALDQLMAMGFSRLRCEKALLATGNRDADSAMNWLFEHMEDPDIESPINNKLASVDVDQESVALIVSMGFTDTQATKALKETNMNVERAIDWLFSHPDCGESPSGGNEKSQDGEGNYKIVGFISHKGSSVHCGHYVCHLLVDDKWILFNDNRVVHDVNPPFENTYIYFLRRQ
ncbi:ubiquitinyl hydrolase [Rozella allomycis CSF55]|uniref:Ubiquitin carboxyl-terminal hydrolase 14 n=1 Tax=Rozella allomycis (strain CSF55) TaxID=988480 RepID=A0A4P9YPV7_ROZAC|nr:ubiquitinyl hydrolase [Rozella allomycis CSF55]